MKIKYGAIIVDGSGKIGGHVASKNRSGSYLRTKTTPSNPNTTAQANARAILSSLSTGWGALTDDQRKSWNDAVADYAKTDIFGDIKNPSGINLYVKLNANLIASGKAQLSVAPAKIEIPFSSIDSVEAKATVPSIVIAFNDSGFDGVTLRVQSSGVVPAGVSHVKSKMRNIGYTAAAAGEVDVTALYTPKFGTIVAGQAIFFSVAPIMATGQQGTAQFYRVIATA